MGDRKSNFVCVGLLVQMHVEQVEVGALAAILFLCHTNLPCFDARIWPRFHVKTCGHTNWHVDYCYYFKYM